MAESTKAPDGEPNITRVGSASLPPGMAFSYPANTDTQKVTLYINTNITPHSRESPG